MEGVGGALILRRGPKNATALEATARLHQAHFLVTIGPDMDFRLGPNHVNFPLVAGERANDFHAGAALNIAHYAAIRVSSLNQRVVIACWDGLRCGPVGAATLANLEGVTFAESMDRVRRGWGLRSSKLERLLRATFDETF
jgi:hypothetical protein